jgi:hypothetical protein
VAGLLRHTREKSLRKTEEKVAIVMVVGDPAAGSKGGDDVDVAVNRGAVVPFAVAATRETCRGPDVNAEEGLFNAGEI